MIEVIVIILVVLAVLGVVAVGRSVKVVQQYEQGIVFRFGKIQAPPRGAGLTVIRPVGDRMQKVNMQIAAMAVPAQEGITRGNVTVRGGRGGVFPGGGPDQGRHQRAELPVMLPL
jgi:regulator of protease activity HflC (stomatin/prohibitin superfamily)